MNRRKKMALLEEMAKLMKPEAREEFLATLEKMTPDEYAETEKTANQYYLAARGAKSRVAMQKLLRQTQADNNPEGAAAARRRKQMERRNGN